MKTNDNLKVKDQIGIINIQHTSLILTITFRHNLIIIIIFQVIGQIIMNATIKLVTRVKEEKIHLEN